MTQPPSKCCLTKPEVTVGICVKDCEDTIQGVVESIIDQDFPHELMEVVFVDDGSQDRTLSVINAAVKRMNMTAKVFHHDWKGLGPTRNVVVDNAEGDYIVWVDGDMKLPKYYVRKQIEFMEQNSKVGIAGAKYKMDSEANLVAALENIVYVVDSKHMGKIGLDVPVTEGAVYRVKAIRQVGGFDNQITGAGEDLDAAYRVGAAGWLFGETDAELYESCRGTWKSLWDQYVWYGYGGHFIIHKNMKLIAFSKMVPPAGFLAGFLRLPIAYKLTRRKTAFFLPVHYLFKRIAWCFGFLKGHLDGYGHTISTPLLKK